MAEAFQDGSYRSVLEDLDPRAGKLFVSSLSFDSLDYFNSVKEVSLSTRLCTAEDFDESYQLEGDFCINETETLALQGSQAS